MALSSYLKKERTRHLRELKELLSIPSISTDPARAGDVERAARWVSKPWPRRFRNSAMP